MSRAYEMTVTVTEHNFKRKPAIITACKKEWDFEPHKTIKGEIYLSGESCLCGGETEDEFAQRLSGAIWNANRGFCRISLQATYLEDPPSELHEPDENDYEEWKASVRKSNP